jgi:alkyl hydroperoxide reductase subunit AhpC
MDFTFTCPTEILAFNKKYAQFKEAGCEVLGCSIDSEYVHYHWASLPQSQGGLKPTEGKLDIPLIADLKKTIAKDYGVLLEEKGVALRANVLIDPQGVVRHISVNDLPVGRSVDEAFRLLKAFQYTAEHGEVCTADWTVDKPDSMKANPKESLKYFGKQK